MNMFHSRFALSLSKGFDRLSPNGSGRDAKEQK